MRDRSSERMRIKVRQARWKAIGACVRCGVPAGVNRRTGRPFAHCFAHRLMVSDYNKRYVAKRRQVAA